MYSLFLRRTVVQTHNISNKHAFFLHKYFSHSVWGNNLKNATFLRNCAIVPRKDISTQNILRQKAFDVNTNVQKDVILFKYENPKFFTTLNIFAICQFFFWGYLGNFAYTSLKDAPIQEQAGDVQWWRKINLGENKYRNGLTILCFTIGYGILAVSWMYTLKSVRYLVLRKGGQSVTIVTYAPFGENRMMTVDLKYLSCQAARQNATVQLPIKVKNKYLYYLLDMKGEFKNARLFDYTAGLKRLWN